MYVFVSAMLLAMMVPAAPQRTGDGPACHAELRGLTLVTTVDLPSRVRVEGPWKLSHAGALDMTNGTAHFRMEAELDRVVQIDAVTGLERETRLGSPVRLVFEGSDQKDLVRRAAQVWCVTVMRAQENHALDQISPMQPKPVKIALAARAETKA
jgi:hypothetical protein